MAEIRQTLSRGIQEDDVWGAADLLLHEGLRPTIERVRQKIGRGSPNTVSPMLERWFASLGARLAGGATPSANLAAGNDADGVPVSVRNATRLLWETARREAEQVQRQEMEAARAELRENEEALRHGQTELVQREAAFEQARASLNAALASSQQAREALERQLAEQAVEAQRLRASTDHEIARLDALLLEASASKEALRQEHAAALAARDRDLRDAEARHAAQEKRMLADVDRARQAAKQLEAELAREQQRRVRGEEAAAQLRDVDRQALRDAQQAAQQTERALRDQLAAHGIALAQAQSQGAALQQRLDDFQRQSGEEKKSHDATRALLAGALAVVRKPQGARKPSAGRGKA
ncbi:DNA-binding protein [Variovorax sp. MHTC-1]|uniref:DNA-binding protein n=1 Tax=Variovorax sp. MHTC-1 TaxID=2495593 RepID=UPI000F89671F|nr:DNA-binding protein [Variovorax sp. MHTC-1]RST48721.1 DNA-binding protein [Variovorax sp. MHTC-1]